MSACAASLAAQSTVPGQANTPTESIQAMQERISKLEAEVSELTALVKQLQLGSSGLPVSIQTAVETETGRRAQGQVLLPDPAREGPGLERVVVSGDPIAHERGAHESEVAMGQLDCLHRRSTAQTRQLSVEVSDRDLRTKPGQPPGVSAAEPARRTGDDCYLAVELAHQRSSL